MIGTLTVVQDVETYLTSKTTTAPAKVTEWKMEDLMANLHQASTNRNLTRGKELFTKLTCATCHKLNQKKINYRPDLTNMFKHYNQQRAEVLHQILKPSL